MVHCVVYSSRYK